LYCNKYISSKNNRSDLIFGQDKLPLAQIAREDKEATLSLTKKKAFPDDEDDVCEHFEGQSQTHDLLHLK